MEISILLTILLIVLSLGGLFLLEGKICLIKEEQINDSVTIKYYLMNSLYKWAVKFEMKDLYMLNTVTFIGVQKAIQTKLIQPLNLKFEG